MVTVRYDDNGGTIGDTMPMADLWEHFPQKAAIVTIFMIGFDEAFMNRQ